ncbi:Putative anti-sigma factor antagonist BtrV [BD1-7 clade bacterium]|uniref:Anti-sigma factor antagonist n=1 Tax=BD1-7 clade bacterium TaxID=2029982 RepID=A0A5S9MST2_9GAMM|nr:Putative anti-sigma factor antagonist BtrV [BD1-7 clade bacterium]
MSLVITSDFEENQSIAIVRLIGSLDTDTAPQFDTKVAEILAPGVRLVMLDMKHLEYISSAGIRSVFKLFKTMKSRGGKVGASNRQPQIIKVFEIIQALPDMQIFANDDEMDEYLTAVQGKIRNGEDF